jgi:hypothetical protein
METQKNTFNRFPPAKKKLKHNNVHKTLQEIIVKWITNSKKVKWKRSHNALDQPKGKWDGMAFEKRKNKWGLGPHIFLS